MTTEEIAVKLEAHDHEIRSLKHRMSENETQVKVTANLTLSVEKLALTMENMLKEQHRQAQKLQKIEEEPRENWKDMKKAIWHTIISVVAGALATGLILIVAQSVR